MNHITFYIKNIEMRRLHKEGVRRDYRLEKIQKVTERSFYFMQKNVLVSMK